MIFTQYYLDCLSQASYLIGDETTGRAVVVDPRRDVKEYLDDAAAAGLTIELVIETHFHADFLSGHLELAAATGAEIGYGEAASAEFPIRRLQDGERISLGDVTLQILSTPGHTPESISVVVYEHADDVVPYGVLTGDTLFIGDVGRPDLLVSIGVTKEDLAGRLYHSLHDKLMVLPATTRVYPAHGAGSACGKNLSTATVSTIGEQRETNYALAIPRVDDFIAAVTEGQPEAPAYFAYDAARNRQARELLAETEPPRQLSLDEVLELQSQGAFVVDTRDVAEFTAGHLRGAVNIGLDGRYAEYAGSVIPQGKPIVVVAEPGAGHQAKVRLARIGFDDVAGELVDPIAAFVAHPEVVERASRLTAVQLQERIADVPGLVLVDVRNPGEVQLGTIEGARHIPVAHLAEAIDSLDPHIPTVVFCAGGYRSSIAASLLRAAGFDDVSDLLGGYEAWTAKATEEV
jgi:glyoxylase-like metal-dependent hydrolase (beta-lactamase superfamily II)/rhodanese-related sulfurtransferase